MAKSSAGKTPWFDDASDAPMLAEYARKLDSFLDAVADGLLEVIPDAQVWHIGLFRDEATLEPREYYNKLPRRLAADVAIVVDPMLATGGSAVRTCEIVRAAGIPRLVFMAILAAPEGIARLGSEIPEVTIHVAVRDDGLDARGFIVPGLGDAGDRQFGTAAEHA